MNDPALETTRKVTDDEEGNKETLRIVIVGGVALVMLALGIAIGMQIGYAKASQHYEASKAK